MLSENKMMLEKQHDSYSHAPPVVIIYGSLLLSLPAFIAQSISCEINENYRAYQNTYRPHLKELSRKDNSEWCS